MTHANDEEKTGIHATMKLRIRKLRKQVTKTWAYGGGD